MKKTYINPTLEIVKMNMHQQMLSGSKEAAIQSSTQDNSAALGHDDDFDW